MRAALLAVVVSLTACGDSKWPAQPPSLEGLAPAQACDAVAPRALPCTDEMVVEELRQVLQLTYAEAAEMAGDDKPSHKGAKVIHRTQCVADDRYAPAVATCWTAKDCKAFAECVVDTRDKLPRPPRSPRHE